MAKQLTSGAKEDLALALILLKDFKSQDKPPNMEHTLQMLEMVDYLGVKKEWDMLIPKIPPMRIVPR